MDIDWESNRWEFSLEEYEMQDNSDRTQERGTLNTSPPAGYYWCHEDFVPNGLSLSRWRVGLFLRHAFLVDVYRIFDQRQPQARLELHIFRPATFRNWETYAGRKA